MVPNYGIVTDCETGVFVPCCSALCHYIVDSLYGVRWQHDDHAAPHRNQGLGEMYASVMRQCETQLAADVMRVVLEERRQAGGDLAPDWRDYASTLTCFHKVMTIITSQICCVVVI